MLRRIRADLGAVAGFFAGIARLPDAVRASLNPGTETEARILSSQLDMVRTSLKLFDYALPLAGAVIFFFDRYHDHLVLGLWWAVLMLTCFANEIVLERKTPFSDIVKSARVRARQKVVICIVLTVVWGSVAIWLWPGTHADQIFVELLLCCTLAALSTMASLHVASVAGPIILVSASVVLVPLVKDVALHPVLVGMSIIYVVLMLWHAFMIQVRTLRMLQLENERTELIENLRKAKIESDLAHQHAIEASRAKSEFLANMSHELRTPLNAIIGFSDIVRSRALGGSSEKYAEYGAFIHQSGRHLLDLISDILDLAKIDAGCKILHHEPVDVASLIVDESTKAAETARAKGVSLSWTLPRELPLLRADPHALRQILDHLLSNAVKFTPQGGRIEVSADLSPGGEFTISVSDTGIGIAPEDQAQIFDRFGHAHPEVTAAQRGSGLGLPIVKGLADMHGAHIEFESTLGEGTRVSIIFPAASTLTKGEIHAA